MRLYDYWRSSAAYRVRIGLNLKGIEAGQLPVDLRLGEQGGEYRRLNPAALLPALETESGLLSQSLAILEYLDETLPQPRLLPSEPLDRARIRALCHDVASDIHPVNNLRVLKRLRTQFQASDTQVNAWYRHWIETGFEALEARAGQVGSGNWFYRNQLSLVDLVLVPQVYNAHRFEVDMSRYPRLERVYRHANTEPVFSRAAPENQSNQ